MQTTKTSPNAARIEVVVEVPRFGFIKRDTAGRIDVVSPLPCPFNYGSVPGTLAGDGDPVDAVILGPWRAQGAQFSSYLRGTVDFIDAGEEDPKLIVSDRPLSAWDRWQVTNFFRTYAVFKRGLNRARGRK
ncbi:MAG: inorganic diphosphatase, partial [Myxococcota bacterium]